MGKKYLLAVWVVVLSVCGSVLYAEELAEPVFYLPFDGNADAAIAAGDKAPVSESSLKYGKGVSGKAVHITKGCKLAYSCKKNLSQKQGTISFWFKPDWSSRNAIENWPYRYLVSQPWEKGKRVGSGGLCLWFWGHRLRSDLADSRDTYKTTIQEINRGEWYHLAFVWKDLRHYIYLNGKCVTPDIGDRRLQRSVDPKKLPSQPIDFDSFFIGNYKDEKTADGWFDEFKIYDKPLSEAEVRNDYCSATKLRLTTAMTDWKLVGRGAWTVENMSTEKVDGNYVATLFDIKGKVVSKRKLSLALEPGQAKTFHDMFPKTAPGEYRFVLSSPGRSKNGLNELSTSLYILNSKNNLVEDAGQKLKTVPVLSLHVPDSKDSDTYSEVGTTSKQKLNGVEYLEAGSEHNDRFALRLKLPEANGVYLVEWTYPDDKKRTMDVVMQASKTHNQWDDTYMTGVLCGEEYPNSNQMKTFKSLYWARSTDVAIIFMTARMNGPAAVANLRVSLVKGGLPQTSVADADPINGWHRQFGVYFEDPAFNYDFGQKTGLMPNFEISLDRMLAYMKWTGQNFLTYPCVWYDGPLEKYKPRSHPNNYLAIMLRKLDEQNISFMPTINLHTIPLPAGFVPGEAKDPGELHNTPLMIHSNGKINPGGSHGTPPAFNPLHPATQKIVNTYIDDLLDQCADNPSFKGIILHLTKHTLPWFGSIDAGYNDYNIAMFEKETGVSVRVSKTSPERGRLYFNWLMNNSKEKWIDWRCKKISEWYLQIAERLCKRRPDLKLAIFSYNPTLTSFGKRFAKKDAFEDINRESGLDPKYYAKAKNIVITQTICPADYRWSSGGHHRLKDPDNAIYLYKSLFKPETYSIMEKASCPWLNIHDRYFESAIGRLKQDEPNWSVTPGKGKPFNASWLVESPWRVSTLNPTEDYFLEQYLLPLKFNDVQGFCKGGFLIGTLGVEHKLREFAKSYRPLPAVKFTTIPTGNKDITLRYYNNGKQTWFYILNTGRTAETVKIAFGNIVDRVKDLSADTDIAVKAKEFTVKTGPLQLKSYKINGNTKIAIGGK